MTRRKNDKERQELTPESAAYWASKFIIDTQRGAEEEAEEAQKNLEQLGFAIGMTQDA